MKFTCSRADLLDPLELACRVVPTRPYRPVLAGVVVTADAASSTVSVRGFNLAIDLVAEFEATVDEGGSLVVPAKTFLGLLKELPDAPVAFVLDEGSLALQMSMLGGSYTVCGMSPDEFPAPLDVKKLATFEIETPVLRQALEAVTFCAATDETKLVLAGVHFSVNDGQIELGATDGHRLAVSKLEGDALDGLDLTVPTDACVELLKALSKTKVENVAIAYNDSRVMFDLGDVKLTSRVRDGNFPAYNQLLPRDFESTVTVDRRELLATIKRAAVLTDNKVVCLQGNTSGDRLFVTTRQNELGVGSGNLPAQTKGAFDPIAFNHKYLMESLGAMASSEVVLNLNMPTSPVLITPVGGADVKHLIMPVQFREEYVTPPELRQSEPVAA